MYCIVFYFILFRSPSQRSTYGLWFPTASCASAFVLNWATYLCTLENDSLTTSVVGRTKSILQVTQTEDNTPQHLTNRNCGGSIIRTNRSPQQEGTHLNI
jgi:hypothetical protein